MMNLQNRDHPLECIMTNIGILGTALWVHGLYRSEEFSENYAISGLDPKKRQLYLHLFLYFFIKNDSNKFSIFVKLCFLVILYSFIVDF